MFFRMFLFLHKVIHQFLIFFFFKFVFFGNSFFRYLMGANGNFFLNFSLFLFFFKLFLIVRFWGVYGFDMGLFCQSFNTFKICSRFLCLFLNFLLEILFILTQFTTWVMFLNKWILRSFFFFFSFFQLSPQTSRTFRICPQSFQFFLRFFYLYLLFFHV